MNNLGAAVQRIQEHVKRWRNKGIYIKKREGQSKIKIKRLKGNTTRKVKPSEKCKWNKKKVIKQQAPCRFLCECFLQRQVM